MKRRLWFFALFSWMLFLLVSPSHPLAQTIPDPKGDIYVQDFAKILSNDEKNNLIEIGKYLDDHTGAQIAVLTVDSLDNIPVEQYAVQAFRQYKLGNKKENNGVLLLLAIQDRKIYIEVGYGLEGRLPDGKVGRLLDTYALPYLEDNDLSGAVINTYKQLFNEVAAEYKLDKQEKTTSYEYPNNEGPSIFSIIIFTLIFLGIIFLDLRFFGGALTLSLLRLLAVASRFRGGGGGGSGPRSGGGGSAGGGGAGRSW